MTGEKKAKKRGLRLFWRIYFYGLGLLAAVALTAAIATHALRDWDEVPGMRGPTKPLAGMLAAQVSRGSENRNNLQQLLQDIYDVSRVSITIYTDAGERIARAGSFSPQPLSIVDAETLNRQKLFRIKGRLHLAVPLVRDDERLGYALMSWHRPSALTRHLFFLSAVFVVLALMPFLLARAIAKPLAQISTTAKAIGSGDLAARTRVDRRDEVGAVARAVDHMAQRLERMVHSEKELLANVSHEIRTPLARIRVLLELLEEERGGEAAIRSHLASLAEDVIELERLLDDVLLAARLELPVEVEQGAGFTLRRESIEVARLVDKIAERFLDQYDQHPLRLSVQDDLRAVQGDPALLRRVLENLLDNAVKYSEPGAPVELAVTQDQNQTMIEVRDRGMGIPRDDLTRIFEPFFRSDRSRSNKIAGTGIGLTLCHRIVQAHQGTITAQNRKIGGTTFVIILPQW